MNTHVRIAGLLAIGLMAGWTGGCSNKAVQSGGDTSRSKTSLNDVSPSGPERVNPGILSAKADPSIATRQREEMRAEELATAAAGLRDVLFGYDSWTISAEGQQVLTRNADWLRAHERARVKVEGHCDERGSSAYNFVLAEKRAKAVRNYLLELGIKAPRLSVVSYGKERPFCADHSEGCFQQNRRGHLVVTP